MNNKGQKLIGIVIMFLIILAISMIYGAEIYDGMKVTSEITSNISQNNISNKSYILTNNLTIICVSGYSSTVRDVPQKLREQVFARDNVTYALDLPIGSTELDHRVNLAIGGSNDESNLMVQFEEYPGYHEKDKLENYLLKNVCNGNIDINYAQERIYNDWYGYYTEIYG